MKINYLKETEIDQYELMAITKKIVESHLSNKARSAFMKGEPVARNIVDTISNLIVMKIISFNDYVVSNTKIDNMASTLLDVIEINYGKLVAIHDKEKESDND